MNKNIFFTMLILLTVHNQSFCMNLLFACNPIKDLPGYIMHCQRMNRVQENIEKNNQIINSNREEFIINRLIAAGLVKPTNEEEQKELKRKNGRKALEKVNLHPVDMITKFKEEIEETKKLLVALYNLIRSKFTRNS